VNTFSRKPSRSDPSVGVISASGRGAASAVQTLGAVLRQRREEMGVTLAEVEVATRIRQKYLSALESEEWHMLPGEVVGRGFLRNYADYLGLDPQEIMERRRATTDMGMTQALSTTSAGAPLPPEREVDYRPKEVELKDEGDGIQRGEIRLTPILAIVAVAVLVILGVWGLAALREPIGEMLAGAQGGVTGLFRAAEPEPTATSSSIGIVNEENVGEAQVAAMAATATASAQGVFVLGSGGTTPGAVVPGGDGSAQLPPPSAPDDSGGGIILMPTATPEQVAAAPATIAPTPVVEVPTATPEIPTATPAPPTLEPPTATPEVPTETPTPEPTAAPVVAAASCADPRSVISGPGVNQVVAGVTPISGVATHESFQFYKLEYAPGANAGGGFTYFSGGQVQVSGGVLGNLDTTVLPNGEYTIRLTVVDQVGNFPPPCDVSVVVQN
jgi:transcriptional regulator with XRE-family HTH domain